MVKLTIFTSAKIGMKAPLQMTVRVSANVLRWLFLALEFRIHKIMVYEEIITFGLVQNCQMLIISYFIETKHIIIIEYL
jgi:hypothetical protein